MIPSFFSASNPGSPRRKGSAQKSFLKKSASATKETFRNTKAKIRPRPTFSAKRLSRQFDRQSSNLSSHSSLDHVSSEDMNVAETVNGIEVSLDILQRPKVQVVDHFHFLRRAQKITRSQFRMDIPLLEENQTEKIEKENPQPRLQNNHRVPLSNEVASKSKSLDEIVYLLQAHRVTSEYTSVKAEISKLDKEVEAVEKDRGELEQQHLCIPAQEAQNNAWDFDYMLQHYPHEKNELQRLRGRCLTIQLKNPQILDAFCQKLGSEKPVKRKVYQTRITLTQIDSEPLPRLSHLCFVPKQNQTSYFFHFDNMKGQGHVPPRLFRKMKSNSLSLDALKYLSVGPEGSYFAQFDSGHVLWGSSDADFIKVVKDWTIHRVAFGEVRTVGQTKTHTWMVVGRDGRVAFKNLPKPFQEVMEGRLADQAAPSEVSFGSDGAYFVRFLDGVCHYNLPSHLSEMCEYIVHRGGRITNVIMHPELSKDCAIRHTELKS